eukprot:Filipodium_phascolosomae@DN5839_c0_g1_i2.p1
MINACSFALADAGVPMFCLPVACNASLIDQTCLIDLSAIEQAAGAPEMTVALDPITKQVSLLQLAAKVTPEEAEQLYEACQLGCEKQSKRMQSILREYLVRKLSRRIES